MKLNTLELFNEEMEFSQVSGITLHRLTGCEDDVTVGRSLYGYEVDRNFLNLKKREIKDAEYDSVEDKIVITRFDGDEIVLEFNNQSGITELHGEVVSAISYDEETDVIKLTKVNGEELETKISHPIMPKNEPEPGFVIAYLSGETEEETGYFWVKPDFGADRYYLTFWDTLVEPHIYENYRSSIVVGNKIDKYMPTTEPEHYGYTFKGWFLSGTSEEVNPNTKIVDDMNAEAVYDKNKYKAIFKNTNGVVGLTGDTVVGKEFELSASINKTGYELSSITVNDKVVEPVEGEYKYTATGNSIDMKATYYSTASESYKLATSVGDITNADSFVILISANTKSYVVSTAMTGTGIASVTHYDISTYEPLDGDATFKCHKSEDANFYYIEKIKKGVDEKEYLCIGSKSASYVDNIVDATKFSINVSNDNKKVSFIASSNTSLKLYCNESNGNIWKGYTSTTMTLPFVYVKTNETKYFDNIGTQAFSTEFDYLDEFHIKDYGTEDITGWSDDLENTNKERNIVIKKDTLYKPITSREYSVTFNNEKYVSKNDTDFEVLCLTEATDFNSDTTNHRYQLKFDNTHPARVSGMTELFETVSNYTDVSKVSIICSTNINDRAGTGVLKIEIGEDFSSKIIIDSKITTPTEFTFNIPQQEFPEKYPDGKIKISLEITDERSIFIGGSKKEGTTYIAIPSMTITARDAN